MKKTTVLMFAFALAVILFAACSDDTVQDNTPNEPDSIVQDTQTDSTVQPDSYGRKYISPQAEAIVTVAESYLARKIWLQYDNKHWVEPEDGAYQQYRPQYHENSPEDCTSQYAGYTNCSAFTYDVYWEAFGLDIRANSTRKLMDAVDMHVFTYYITGKESEQQKRQIEQEFIDSLQQGDIIVCDHPEPQGGHALIYIGDEMMIDSGYLSSLGGGNYDYENNHDRVEIDGSVQYKGLMEFFEPDDYYYFWEETGWAIVRPLDKFDYAEITEKTLNRMKNLKKIYVEKLSSHPLGRTADLNEEITFSFYIRNDGDTDAVLDIVDKVPEHTTYVSGGDSIAGNTLSWRVNIPAGKDVTVEYTVKVDNDPSLYDGGYIYGEDAYVGGVSVRCRKVFVGKHLSYEQEIALRAATFDAKDMSQRGIELANKLYEMAGINIDLPDVNELFSQLLTPSKRGGGHMKLRLEGKYSEMVVPTLYGGSFVVTSSLFDKERTRGVQPYQLYTGDIMIGIEKDKTYLYMCAGENRLLDLSTGETLLNISMRETLLSGQGMHKFVFIRPTAVYNQYQ